MWDRIAQGIFLIIVVGGVILYQYGENCERRSQTPTLNH